MMGLECLMNKKRALQATTQQYCSDLQSHKHNFLANPLADDKANHTTPGGLRAFDSLERFASVWKGLLGHEHIEIIKGHLHPALQHSTNE